MNMPKLQIFPFYCISSGFKILIVRPILYICIFYILYAYSRYTILPHFTETLNLYSFSTLTWTATSSSSSCWCYRTDSCKSWKNLYLAIIFLEGLHLISVIWENVLFLRLDKGLVDRDSLTVVWLVYFSGYKNTKRK